MELIFEKVFKVPLTAMKLNRSHPDIPKNFRWLFSFLIIHGLFSIIFILFVYNIFWYNLKFQNFVQTCKNGTMSVVYIAVTFKYMVLIWKGDSLKSMFNTVKFNYSQARFLSVEDREIVFKYAKKAAWFSNLWFVVSVIGVAGFIIKNILLNIYYNSFGDFRIIPLYELVYPTSIEVRKDNIYVYSVLYLCILYYESYFCCIYTSFAPLGSNFMLHACGQLEILTKRVDKLFSADDVISEIKSIVLELQRIYNFVEEIKDTFRISYELILKSNAIILPVTTYEVIEAFKEGEVSVEFLVFIGGGTLLASSPCHYSEMLMAKGETLRMAVYSCGWERISDKRTRKMITLLLQRASQPIVLRTMFKDLCLETLTDVYHMAYAIFNLMNAMWN